MNEDRKQKIEAAGFRVTTAEELLGLTSEDIAVIDERIEADRVRRILASMLKEKRGGRITQTALAIRIDSSQSRIAKAEAASSSVSLDLLFRANFAVGASLQEIGNALMTSGSAISPDIPQVNGKAVSKKRTAASRA